MMLRSGRVSGLTPALFLGVAVMAACSDSAMGPSTADAVRFPTTVSKVVQGEEVCENVTFEQLSHNDVVTTNQFSIFGSFLTFSAVRYADNGAHDVGELRILDPGVAEGPDLDLRRPAAGGQCVSCISKLLVINDPDDDTPTSPSDNANGGEILITGFPANTYIKSYSLADHEATEAASQLFVDGLNIAPAVQPGAEHEVITINTTAERLITNTGVRFILGDDAPPTLGSAAIDNIQVCKRVVVLGDDGCTPGFWKNHEAAWAHTPYDPDQTVESVFNVPDAYGLDNVTLLAVLSMGGGGSTADVAARLLHHAVAALLNASHGLVDYAQTGASIIAETNAALASGNKTTMNNLKDKFDRQNNAGCPINGKEPLP
jgi:hypothetical protein